MIHKEKTEEKEEGFVHWQYKTESNAYFEHVYLCLKKQHICNNFDVKVILVIYCMQLLKSGLTFDPHHQHLSSPRYWISVAISGCRFFRMHKIRKSHLNFSYLCVCVCVHAYMSNLVVWYSQKDNCVFINTFVYHVLIKHFSLAVF